LGTPEAVAANPKSYTGQYLKKMLEKVSSRKNGKRNRAAS